MYERKKMERYLQVNMLGTGPRLMKKEFTGPRSHKGWEKLIYRTGHRPQDSIILLQRRYNGRSKSR